MYPLVCFVTNYGVLCGHMQSIIGCNALSCCHQCGMAVDNIIKCNFLLLLKQLK
jgi:hypothetical protein